MDLLPDKIRQQFLTWSLQKPTTNKFASTQDLDQISNVCIDSIGHVSSVLQNIAQRNPNAWTDEDMASFENSKRCLKHILFLIASEKQIDRSEKFKEKILDIVAALSSAYWDVLFLQNTRCAIADEEFENAIGACFHFLDCSINHTMDAFLQCESPDSPPSDLVKIYVGKLRDQLKIDKSEPISKNIFLKGVLIYQKAGRSIGCGRKVEKSLKKVLLKRHRSNAEETMQWIRDTCGEILDEDLTEEFTIDRLFDSNFMIAKNCDALLTALTGISSFEEADEIPSSPAPLRTVISEIEEALERLDEPMETDRQPTNRGGESMPNDDTSSDDFGTTGKKSMDQPINSPEIHFLRSPSNSPTLSRVLRSKVNSITKRLARQEDEGEGQFGSESTSVVSDSPRKKRSEKLINYESSLDAASSPEPKPNQSRRSKRNSSTTMDGEPIEKEVEESSNSQGSIVFDHESLLRSPNRNDFDSSTPISKTPIDGQTSSKPDRSMVGGESSTTRPLARRRLFFEQEPIVSSTQSDGQESSSIKKIGAQESPSISGSGKRPSPIKSSNQASASEKTGIQKSPSTSAGKQASPAKTPIQRSPSDQIGNRSPSPDSRPQKKRPASEIPIAAAGGAACRPKKKRLGADVQLIEEGKKEHIAMTPGYNTRARLNKTPAVGK